MTTRHNRAGIDDRWFRKVKTDEGMKIVPSPLHGSVKRWRVRWVAGGVEKTKVFDRKPDAQKHLNKVLQEIANGAVYSRESFGAVAEAWFATKSHRKPKTIAGYRSLLDTIVLPRWGTVELSDINYENYTAWLGSLSTAPSKRRTGLSASRITQAHQLVGAVLSYAVKTGKLSRNVAHDLKRSQDLPRPIERKHRYLTHEELIKLANAMEGYQVLTLVLGYCGLRFGEAAALRGVHVGDAELDIRSSASTVTKLGVVEGATKTHKSRVVPVPEAVWKALKTQLPDNPVDLVFPDGDTYLRSDKYRRAFLKACSEVGIEGATPHDLRHTAASLAISEGANPKVVQRMLGHASAAMTLDVYAELFDDDLAAVAKALSSAIEATAVPLRYPGKTGKEKISQEQLNSR
jgi:integrase